MRTSASVAGSVGPASVEGPLNVGKVHTLRGELTESTETLEQGEQTLVRPSRVGDEFGDHVTVLSRVTANQLGFPVCLYMTTKTIPEFFVFDEDEICTI